jgi:hypothetical protein
MKKVEKDTVQKLFCKSLKKTAKLLKKEPSEVSKIEFYANDEEDVTDWAIRKFGSFAALKDLYFPSQVDATVKQGSKIVRNFRKKLEKEYGQRDFIQDEILGTLKEVLEKNPIKMHKPIKSSSKKKVKKSRTIVAHISDTHFGTNIDTKELGGVNEYNWTIASRRMALFSEQIAKYKRHYRNETDLVLVVNGDLIGGLIHNQEWAVDLWTIQFAGAVDIMVQAISYLANNFSKVVIEWGTGNHGRLVSKADKGRASAQKWDSLESTIGLAVKLIIEKTCKNVKINIPMTPYNIFEVQGHMLFSTHGDTVFSTGNVGSSLNMKSINTQIAKLNASELGGDRKFAAVMCGHVHTPLATLTESGAMMIINGTLSGTDSFAQSIGIFRNNPTQQLFEVTEAHAVGDMRFIQVGTADKETRFDEIIKPFKGFLE